MSTLLARKAELKAQLNSMDIREIFNTFGKPVAAILLPKQRALSRITRKFLEHSGLTFKDTTSRIDHTYAVNADTGVCYRVSVDYTTDALTKINKFKGIKISKDDTETVPVLAIVGYDGFASLRNGHAGTDKWFAHVEQSLQTTKAGLVLASDKAEHLHNLRGQDIIATAATYNGIYKHFLDEAYGCNHEIGLLPLKGGTEGAAALLSDVSVIGDLTDSGGSLAENGLNYVLPISDAAPVIVMHTDWREFTSPANQVVIEDLKRHFLEASQKAFPQESIFDIRLSGHATDPRIIKNQTDLENSVVSLSDYLESRGKSGVRPEGDATINFYGMALGMD